MPKHKKTWILTKGTEFKRGGSISLGQILIEPYQPSFTLLPPDGLVAIPETSIERTSQTKIQSSSSPGLTVSFNLWSEADLLPVSGKIGGKHRRSQTEKWTFDKLESEIAFVSREDVQATLDRKEIIAHLQKGNFLFGKRLYMINGVRIAKGAKKSCENSKTRAGNAKVMADFMAVGVPAKLGPEVEVTREDQESYSFEQDDPFVFAYRLCEVYYGKDVYTTPYIKGETFTVGKNLDEEGVSRQEDDDDDDEDDEDKNKKIRVEDIADEDFSTIEPNMEVRMSGEDEQIIMRENN
jgi:hypothetical protein